ncbi:MAG: endonuclease YncB(thermonuclease family) [Cognaticolwellia sp.]|jgi:endonuclease YncB( thermonuclease family)
MWLLLLACTSQDKVPYFDGCGACDPDELKWVAEVIDGDTVRFEGDEESTRLLGIDTPEVFTDSSIPECYGAEASDFMKDLLPPGTQVLLRFDTDDNLVDVVGRNLAYVNVALDLEDREQPIFNSSTDWALSDSEFVEKVHVNRELLVKGYASLIEEDDFIEGLRYEETLRNAQDLAIENGAGLWLACEESQ